VIVNRALIEKRRALRLETAPMCTYMLYHTPLPFLSETLISHADLPETLILRGAMALSLCDRVRALPKVIYHLLMMFVAVCITAAFGFYVLEAIHDDGFTYQTMYAMSAGAYIVPRFSADVYSNAKDLFEHIWFSLARWCSGATRRLDIIAVRGWNPIRTLASIGLPTQAGRQHQCGELSGCVYSLHVATSVGPCVTQPLVRTKWKQWFAADETIVLVEGSHALATLMQYLDACRIGESINGVCISRAQASIEYNLKQTSWSVHFQCPRNAGGICFGRGEFMARPPVFSVLKRFSYFRMTIHHEAKDEWKKGANGQYEKITASVILRSTSRTDLLEFLYQCRDVAYDATAAPSTRPRTETIVEPLLRV
jgi:hypothetical protein